MTSTAPALTTKESPRQRRFQVSDIAEIANLLAKRHSERMACSLLGIKYQSWADWKCRNKNDSKFAEHFSKARAIQYDSHVNNIESFEKKDWRASYALINLKFPELDPKNNQTQQPQVIPALLLEAMKQIYGKEEPKQLPEPPKAIDV